MNWRQLFPGMSPILCDEACLRAADWDFQKTWQLWWSAPHFRRSGVLGKGAGLLGVSVLELGGTMEAIQVIHCRDHMYNPSQNWDWNQVS